MITPEKYASQLYAEAIDFTKSKKKAAKLHAGRLLL